MSVNPTAAYERWIAANPAPELKPSATPAYVGRHRGQPDAAETARPQVQPARELTAAAV